MELQVTPISPEERKRFSNMVIGKAICPICGQEAKVVNDQGEQGNPFFNYLEDHSMHCCSDLCGGSEQMLNSF